MKIGRNEKCWCGSKKKFKYCHYGREKEQPLSKGEAIGESKKIGSRKCCYVPDELKGECDKKIINAHTISKSGSLKEIADSTNHVLGLKIDLANFFKHEGRLIPERIGINQASTFSGFCAKHDKELFSCIEDQEFCGSERQLHALMYRSVAKELYAKEGSFLTSQLLKGGDKGRHPIDQLFIQNFAASNQSGVEAAQKELSELKRKLDEQFLGKTRSNFSHLIVRAKSPVPVAVSSIVSPVSDFEGNLIQDLGDLSVPAESLVFNSFSSDGKGYVVFSWLKESSKVLGFINTFLAIDSDGLFSALIRFFFGVSENTFISPVWWDSLEASQKCKIQELIMAGVNPFEFEPKKLLVDDGVVFTGLEVGDITKVNF
ncbi:SEC-C metal-binding domain-containing protein [Salinicola sp. LHM]|uniref:SEC-C metal-binding domain-containing protein n=1 Tax=Salinicola sp. LHM TaxID=3065298 RepID=UPI002ACF0717|nr:SEC-C metal-binding domain-containing protein [Salinicola sp. LHM]MED5501047.1 SEC-C metal-binding domain-containing protein [Pseudomonadota bacterium]WQH33189.1 SEC-C metal-binding domain-containing protein [Salinicola sp. LHM]